MEKGQAKKYGAGSLTTAFASLQWLIFIFANTVVVPISIGAAFQLDVGTVEGMLRSSFIFTGLACVLQGWIGHRYPLMEGHSGMTWGLFLNLCISASSMGLSYTDIGGGIATGLLLSGAVVIVLGALGWLAFLPKIFTPMVMSVYLFLLTFQLIFIFSKGMLKVTEDGALDLPVSLFSVALVALVIVLQIKGGKVVGNFALLIAMVVGWVLFTFLFPSEGALSAPSGMGFPIFPLGAPNMQVGIVVVTFLASLLNLSNTIAAVRAASHVFQETPSKGRFHRSYLLNGVYTAGAAVFGLVPYAPFTSSIGFLESTRIFDRKPFLISGGLMALIGIVPALGSLLSTLPITVGNAVLFAAYLQLFGTSLKSLGGTAGAFNSRTIHRLAIPVLVGISLMNLDASLYSKLPPLIQPLITNGFITGVLISIVLEKIVWWGRLE